MATQAGSFLVAALLLGNQWWGGGDKVMNIWYQPGGQPTVIDSQGIVLGGGSRTWFGPPPTQIFISPAAGATYLGTEYSFHHQPRHGYGGWGPYHGGSGYHYGWDRYDQQNRVELIHHWDRLPPGVMTPGSYGGVYGQVSDFPTPERMQARREALESELSRTRAALEALEREVQAAGAAVQETTPEALDEAASPEVPAVQSDVPSP